MNVSRIDMIQVHAGNFPVHGAATHPHRVRISGEIFFITDEDLANVMKVVEALGLL